jgi:phenylpropionate dioxygenase-like ring-hydroxylating dioxygenase large terminal subunit
MEAHCPHMGAHLAEGRVEDEEIRCFFHNWRFDAQGRCTEVPCLERLPAGVSTRVWPTAERHGLIWVWTSAAPLPPEAALPPDPPALAGRAIEVRVGRRFVKACHPSVVMVNAIDEQHFRTVHRLPGEILSMEPEDRSTSNIVFRNFGRVPATSWLGRLVKRFYAGPLTYELSYWYGTNGFVTFGPDRLRMHLLFALRRGANGQTEGMAVALAPKRRGVFGWLLNRAVLWITGIGGAYFAIGDTRVFKTIRFDFRTPIKADRAVIAFIRHLERQRLAEGWRE